MGLGLGGEALALIVLASAHHAAKHLDSLALFLPLVHCRLHLLHLHLPELRPLGSFHALHLGRLACLEPTAQYLGEARGPA